MTKYLPVEIGSVAVGFGVQKRQASGRGVAPAGRRDRQSQAPDRQSWGPRWWFMTCMGRWDGLGFGIVASLNKLSACISLCFCHLPDNRLAPRARRGCARMTKGRSPDKQQSRPGDEETERKIVVASKACSAGPSAHSLPTKVHRM